MIKRCTWWASGTLITSTAREYTHSPASAAAPTLTICAGSDTPSNVSSKYQTE